MKYYVGSIKINDDGTFDPETAYIVLEDYLNAIKMIKEEGGFPEELRHEQSGDFYPQITLNEKMKPDKNGNTHAILMSRPYVPPQSDEIKAAAGTGTPTEQQQEEAKKRIEAEQDSIPLDEIPF